VAWEYQVINYRDITKNPVEAVGEDMHNSPHKLIRLSDHKQAMEEQREEIIEMLEEDGELYEIILERFKEAEDDTIWYNKFGTLFDVILQDLKQKLKEGEDEAREDE